MLYHLFQKYIHKLWYSDSNCLSYIYYLFLSVLWSFYLEKINFFTQIWLEINDLIFLYFYLPCGIHVYLPCGIHVPNHITKMLLYRYMQCKLQLFVLHNIVFNVLSDNKNCCYKLLKFELKNKIVLSHVCIYKCIITQFRTNLFRNYSFIQVRRFMTY